MTGNRCSSVAGEVVAVGNIAVLKSSTKTKKKKKEESPRILRKTKRLSVP